jgi:hypothetical protein
VHDVFICHASEDKASVARPLARILGERGITSWIDEGQLTLGDSLRQKLDEGLSESRFGVVVLSPNFFAKRWPKWELDGLVDREVTSGQKVVLPVWHDVDHAAVSVFSPSLANKLAVRTSEGIEVVADAIAQALSAQVSNRASTTGSQTRSSMVDPEASGASAESGDGPAVVLWHDTAWFADPAHRDQSLPLRNVGRRQALNVEVQVYWHGGNCALATTSIAAGEQTRMFARTPIADLSEAWGRATYSDFAGRRWETRFKIETGPDGQPRFQLRAYGLTDLLPMAAYPAGWDYESNGLPNIGLPEGTRRPNI